MHAKSGLRVGFKWKIFRPDSVIADVIGLNQCKGFDMPSFNDQNTVDDILGCVFCLQIDIHKASPEFSVADQFTQLDERITQKLGNITNIVRHNWFSLAREKSRKALVCFDGGQLEDADSHLLECESLIRDGNKAHRRKASFTVSPDGTVRGDEKPGKY